MAMRHSKFAAIVNHHHQYNNHDHDCKLRDNNEIVKLFPSKIHLQCSRVPVEKEAQFTDFSLKPASIFAFRFVSQYFFLHHKVFPTDIILIS